MERDKFLTEAMGDCWHGKAQKTGVFHACDECGKTLLDFSGAVSKDRDDFSTWEGFGKLWEWAQKQDWWERFYEDNLCWCEEGDMYLYYVFNVSFVNPDHFANTVYHYLNQRV